MALDRLDDIGVQVAQFVNHGKAAVVLITARPACNLANLRSIQAAGLAAIELGQPSEGHMVQVHIQAHADGVCCHQIVHLASLEHGHLRVAGAGAERAQHHRCATAVAANRIRRGVDVLGRKGHHRRALGDARQLLGRHIGQLGKARLGGDAHVGHQALHQGLDGRRAHEHGLLKPARIQQALGEDVATLGIAGELDFIDREELGGDVQGHALDGANPVGGRLGHDLLFAGQKRHLLRAAFHHQLVIDLARQKAQRKAHDARLVGQHALDRVVGLAGVGRPQDRRHKRIVIAHGTDLPVRL